MGKITAKEEKKTIHRFNPKIVLYSSEYNKLTTGFKCGKPIFDEYLCEQALEEMSSGDGVTYIILDEDENVLIAYYTISTSTVHFVDMYDYEDEEIPEEKKRKHYSPISSVIINMFAVNSKYQDCIYEGEIVSDLIIQAIIGRIYNMSTSIIGAKMIILCSVPDAVDFYKRNNFKELPPELTLFDHIDLSGNKAMYLTLHCSAQ